MSNDKVAFADQVVTTVIVLEARPANSFFSDTILLNVVFTSDFQFGNFFNNFGCDWLRVFRSRDEKGIVTDSDANQVTAAVRVDTAPLSPVLAIFLARTALQPIVLADKRVTAIVISLTRLCNAGLRLTSWVFFRLGGNGRSSQACYNKSE